MKVVYVAGPFRGPTAWDIQQNVRRAEQCALEVAKLGAMPICPHKNTENFHGLLTDSFWLDGTLELMRRCDGVYAMPSWKRSLGATAEVEEAQRLGIPVFFSFSEMVAWLGNGPRAAEATP